MFRRIGPFRKVEIISRSHDLSGFNCGNPDFDDFIKNDAFKDLASGHSATYLGLDDERPIAYLSLVAAAYQTMLVPKADQECYGYNQIPAIKIARIATDESFQNHGCGEFLIHYSIAMALKIRRFIGCKLLVTDALPEKIQWYKDRGFILSMSSRGPVKRENYPMYQILPKIRIGEGNRAKN